MSAYRVTFERIGRKKEFEPVVFDNVAGEADLCRKIRAHARPHLMSRDFDVMIDLDKGQGFLSCGMRNGGTFAISQL